MVGIFSRFSVSRYGHRRSQSALDEREVLPPNSEMTGTANAAAAAAVASSHGIEVAVEFKPVEHPNEPLDNDRPIQCPLPEPSILNDRRIWKERVSATVHRRADLPVMKEGASLEADGAETKPKPMQTQANLPVMKEGASLEADGAETKPKPTQTQANRSILPSLSAPEHNILNLLEECNASGI